MGKQHWVWGVLEQRSSLTYFHVLSKRASVRPQICLHRLVFAVCWVATLMTSKSIVGHSQSQRQEALKALQRKQTDKWNDKCIFINHSDGEKKVENMVIFHQSLPQLHKGDGSLFGKWWPFSFSQKYTLSNAENNSEDDTRCTRLKITSPYTRHVKY